jgi:hypothetical protein
MKKLATAFPASFGDEQKVTGAAALWRDMLDQHPWVTRGVFVGGVYAIAWEHKGDFLPPPGQVLDYLHAAKRRVEAEQRKALPPPPERPPETQYSRMTGPERAAFLERHIALGKLRARYGETDLNVPFDPPGGEQGVMGMIGQMRAEGFMRRQLERVAAGELVSPGDLIDGGLRGRL